MAKDMLRLLQKAEITLIDAADAKARWRQFRLANGFSPVAPLLSDDTSNFKLAKSAKKGYRTLGLSLAHSKTSGDYNVCRYSTPVCEASCVADAGNGNYPKVKKARALKTKFLAEDPSAFISLLVAEIDEWVAKHGDVAVRLNTFSDIPWEEVAPELFTRWGSKVTFYDYTKWPVSARPDNDDYDLTRSASERTTDAQIKEWLDDGARVAVCIDIKRTDAAPATFLGHPCIDGDTSDARFLEDKGTVVLLRPKGSARINGFARPHKE